MTDKKIAAPEYAPENAMLLKLLGRLLSALDASISGKKRRIFVSELANLIWQTSAHK